MVSRRLFLNALASACLFKSRLAAKEAKPLAGVFPIVQTPFSSDDKLDVKALAGEIRFLDRTGVHGVVWPQLASEYFDLTRKERMTGMEVVAGAGNTLRPAVVLGVQGDDTAAALEYVKHAEKLGPDGLIALPPRGWKDTQKIFDYYRAIGERANVPLFAQAVGDMSVDFVLKLAEQVPHLQFVKDEAGESLPRLSEFRRRGRDHLRGVFTGAHGRNMIDELSRGSAGTMPAAGFADLYVRVWDAWRAGDRAKAIDHFSRVMLLVTQVNAYGLPGMKYLLQLRGVFPNSICRSTSRNSAFDEEAKKLLKETLDFVKPHLKT